MLDFEKRSWVAKCAARFTLLSGCNHSDAERLARSCFANRISPEDRPEDAAEFDFALWIPGQWPVSVQ